MPIGDATREPAISPKPEACSHAYWRRDLRQPRIVRPAAHHHPAHESTPPKLNHYEIADDDAAAAGVLDAAVGIAAVPSTSA